MDKITYLAELAEGLARWVPERERQDILRYYAEYFEEAGPGREAEVVAELGDPWALSCRLAVEGGYVTQEAASSWTPARQKRKKWPLVLVASVAVLAILGMSVASFASHMWRFVTRDYPVRQVTVYEENPMQAYEWDEAMLVEGAGTEYATVTGAEFTEQFDKVKIDVSLGDVMIYTGDQAAVSMVNDEDFNCFYEWKVEGGTLKVYDREKNNFTFKARPEFSGSVMVTVPYGVGLDKVEVNTGVGDVMLEGSLLAEKLTVNTGIGDVYCYYPVAAEIELNSGLGDVDLYTDAETGERIELNSGTGNVELYGCPAPKMKLHSGTGTVTAALEACAPGECACDLSTGFGDVALDGRDCGTSVKTWGNGSYELEAASGFGNVCVWFNG